MHSGTEVHQHNHKTIHIGILVAGYQTISAIRKDVSIGAAVTGQWQKMRAPHDEGGYFDIHHASLKLPS
jgi:hypothetical protein